MPGDFQMINKPSLLYENTGYTRQAHSFHSWKVCFGTAEPLSYFFTNEFTFSSTPASAASRIVRSVQHLSTCFYLSDDSEEGTVTSINLSYIVHMTHQPCTQGEKSSSGSKSEIVSENKKVP